MLSKLSIGNYAIISQLEIEPSEGLNTITGETGAGKSIMIGALGLLLGNRADSKVLLDSERKCVVEGEFDLKPYGVQQFFKENELDYYDDTIVRREIAVSGKSRAFINDTPVTLDVLKQLMLNLIDIHSQHDTMLLGVGDTQLQIIDLYAQNQNVLADYQDKYFAFKQIEHTLNELKENQFNQNKELDFNKFQLNELNEVGLSTDEKFKKEENELGEVENAEEIKSTLSQIVEGGSNSESSLLSSLNDIRALLKSISSYSSDLEAISERLESTSLELNDIFSELEHKEQDVFLEPERVEELRNKVDAINSLLHKHNVFTVSELIELKESLSDKVRTVEQFDERLEELQHQMNQSQAELDQAANNLTLSRTTVFEKLQVNIEHILVELGIPNAQFEIRSADRQYTKSGTNDIQLLFSANKGVATQTLKQAASGGEFSRLMFAIKYLLADKTSLPTIIFDEIDTGISGEIAIKMGKMMQKMSQNHQVITITHLPQVAAIGSKHYFVYKDEVEGRTNSQMKELHGDERELEIAKMIAGDNPSTVAFENARELLSLHRSF